MVSIKQTFLFEMASPLSGAILLSASALSSSRYNYKVKCWPSSGHLEIILSPDWVLVPCHCCLGFWLA